MITPRTVRIVLLVALILALLAVIGRTVFDGDRESRGALGNPFYDIFYRYYSGREDVAKRDLRALFGSTRHGAHALINDGVLRAREGDSDGATRSFGHAFDRGASLALSYLSSLRARTGAGYREFLAENPLVRETQWAEYELAVAAASERRDPDARSHLARAIARGFASTELMDQEPAFVRMRNDDTYKRLREAADANRALRISLSRLMRAERARTDGGKASYVPEAIETANALERVGRRAEAEQALLPLTASSAPFRDRAMATYRLARIRATMGDRAGSRAYLERFRSMIASGESDPTGFKDCAARFQDDIIRNDPLLR
ncbi:MAG TPA: hypothetical protein PKM65_07930 [Spirochaetota bacterium]|nr:hypothetical protein [Spirochaetota bacterium]HNT09709.1 hypothetical protein [Spirochaetota bacterium]